MEGLNDTSRSRGWPGRGGGVSQALRHQGTKEQGIRNRLVPEQRPAAPSVYFFAANRPLFPPHTYISFIHASHLSSVCQFPSQGYSTWQMPDGLLLVGSTCQTELQPV